LVQFWYGTGLVGTVLLQDWYSWYSSVTVGRASGAGIGLVYMVQFCNSREGEWCRYRTGIVGTVL
jgi:hypothetical protein